uniref:TNF-related apoptosis inducing ligand-like n=1 Tax=Gallus gallus TaxID=9031 RepID=A0A8V0ZGM2_CHICK
MAPQQPSAGQYLRSDSGGSATRMLGDGPGADPGGLRERRRRCGPLWGSVAVMAILALQIASTTGLFVYFTMAISKLKAQSQGSSEELRCLQLINQQQEGSNLEELISNQSCLKLANTIKAYVATVTENVISRSVVNEAQKSYFNISEGQVATKTLGKPSAHLIFRPQNPAQDGALGTSRSPAAMPSLAGRTAPSTHTCRTSHTGTAGCGSTRQASTTSTPRSTSATPATGPAPVSQCRSSCSASTGRPPTASPSSCSKGWAPSAGHPRQNTASTLSTREDCLSSRPVMSSSSPSPRWPLTTVTQQPAILGPSGSTCDSLLILTPSLCSCWIDNSAWPRAEAI